MKTSLHRRATRGSKGPSFYTIQGRVPMTTMWCGIEFVPRRQIRRLRVEGQDPEAWVLARAAELYRAFCTGRRPRYCELRVVDSTGTEIVE